MKGITTEEKRDLIISIGTHRTQRKLIPVQVAILIQKSLDAGSTLDEILEEITLNERTANKFLLLLSLPSDIRSLIGWGSDPTTISFTAAAEIARLETEDEKRILTKATLEHKLAVPEMKQVIQIRQRSNKTIEQSIDAVIRQRPILERKYLIVGKLLLVDPSAQLKNLLQHERNNLLERALIIHGPGKPTYGVKLTDEYFYITGDKDYYEKILSLPNGFEKAIAGFLWKELNGEK